MGLTGAGFRARMERMPVTLVPVARDDVRLARLMQLYLHEWSAIFPDRVRIGADALFTYPAASPCCARCCSSTTQRRSASR